MNGMLGRLGLVAIVCMTLGFLIGETPIANAMIALLDDYPVCDCKPDCHMERRAIKDAQGNVVSYQFHCEGGCGTSPPCQLVSSPSPDPPVPPPPPGGYQVTCYCGSTQVVEQWCYMGWAIVAPDGSWSYNCRQNFSQGFCTYHCSEGYCVESGPGGGTIWHENCCCQEE